MTENSRVQVALGARSYSIQIGEGLLATAGATISAVLPRCRRVVLLSNPTVDALYGRRVIASLRAAGMIVDVILIPDGERFKTWETLDQILTQMLTLGIDRSSVLVALGGGVVGDIGGFAAAIYQRGIAFVQIPTTLLAQVDSSVGGKVAVNHPLGKNMLGAFYQPKVVLIDLAVLRSLPAREITAGLAEVIKYGFIGESDFVTWFEENTDNLRALKPEQIAFAVRKSCEAKAAIVAADETETGVRALLNFGHTFAHAIESGLGFGAWLHGEAVGAGMVAAAALSHRLGRISELDATRVRALVSRIGCPVDLPPLGATRYWELMQMDKKAENEKVTFILLNKIGFAEVVRAVAFADVVPLLK
jgi:3-dehydroquinate synthase